MDALNVFVSSNQCSNINFYGHKLTNVQRSISFCVLSFSLIAKRTLGVIKDIALKRYSLFFIFEYRYLQLELTVCEDCLIFFFSESRLWVLTARYPLAAMCVLIRSLSANSHTYYYLVTTHSLFHSRLKTFLFRKSFPLQPFISSS